jgi:hypothetical protein
MKNTEKDDYIVLFRGAKLRKREANRTGLSIVCGFIGLAVAILLFGTENDITVTSITMLSAITGYLVLGGTLIKK